LPRRDRHIGARGPGAGAALLLLLVLALAANDAGAQGSGGANVQTEPRILIDVPTAGMLRGGMTSFRGDFFSADGVNAGFFYGVTDRIMIGVSYGGTLILGNHSPDWNEIPGFLARVRIVEESEGFPAFAVGFESQGSDGYIDAMDRFVIKSPGFYLAMSKNYEASGYLGIHAGVNYSLEHDDGDKDISLFGGLDKSIGSFLSVEAEYNFAWNDNSGNAIGRGRGYLNAGISVYPGAGITLSIHFKDLLENQPHEGFANRTLRLEIAR
jgi:hypothetical protein